MLAMTDTKHISTFWENDNRRMVVSMGIAALFPTTILVLLLFLRPAAAIPPETFDDFSYDLNDPGSTTILADVSGGSPAKSVAAATECFAAIEETAARVAAK